MTEKVLNEIPASWLDGSSLRSRTRNCKRYDVAFISHDVVGDKEIATDVSDKRLVPELMGIFVCG